MQPNGRDNHRPSPHNAGNTAPVSVIVPAYNCAPYIQDALQSALNQDPAPLELIVADDGSTDETRDVVLSFGPPVRYHRLEGSRNGAAAARNAALQLSEGEYLAFLDADDVWLPGKLAAQLQVLEANPHVSLCATAFDMWRRQDDGTWPNSTDLFSHNRLLDGDNTPKIDPSRSGCLYTRLLLKTLVWTSTVVIRRGLYEDLGGFREDLRLGQDYEYWLRASRTTHIITLSRPFALYRKRPDSATATWAPINYELIAVRDALKKWGRTGPDGDKVSTTQLRHRFASLHFNMAYNQFHAGAPGRALFAACKAAFFRPSMVPAWFYVARSIVYFTTRASRVFFSKPRS